MRFTQRRSASYARTPGSPCLVRFARILEPRSMGATMKRIVLLTTGIAALVFSGLAVAHATRSHSIKGVSATFTATSVSNLRTSSCVGAEGTPFTYTRATYSGTATSADPTLNGPVTLDLSSYISTTTGYGTVAGKLRITTATTAIPTPTSTLSRRTTRSPVWLPAASTVRRGSSRTSRPTLLRQRVWRTASSVQPPAATPSRVCPAAASSRARRSPSGSMPSATPRPSRRPRSPQPA